MGVTQGTAGAAGMVAGGKTGQLAMAAAISGGKAGPSVVSPAPGSAAATVAVAGGRLGMSSFSAAVSATPVLPAAGAATPAVPPVARSAALAAAARACMAHGLFGLDILEGMACAHCGRSSRQMKYTAFLHNVNASALRQAKVGGGGVGEGEEANALCRQSKRTRKASEVRKGLQGWMALCLSVLSQSFAHRQSSSSQGSSVSVLAVSGCSELSSFSSPLPYCWLTSVDSLLYLPAGGSSVRLLLLSPRSL